MADALKPWRCTGCGYITLEPPDHPDGSDCDLARTGLDSWDGVDGLDDALAQAFMLGAAASRANREEIARAQRGAA